MSSEHVVYTGQTHLDFTAPRRYNISMKRLIPLAALFLMLLPSCVRWSIGENIRESTKWRYAVDATQRHCIAGDKAGTIVVPECRFHDSHPIVGFEFPEFNYCSAD